MHIAVCINRVPDTASRVNVVDGAVDTARLTMVTNPYDEYAMEEAVRIKEKREGTTVTAFSAGGPEHYDVLRKALAMGADKACLVEGALKEDSLCVAESLARAIADYYGHAPDLVICGKESFDCSRAQVPLMLAEKLGVASLSAVSMLTWQNGTLEAVREIEGGTELYELALPAVISVEKGLNIPRKTNIKSVMKARKQEIMHLDGSVDRQPAVAYRDFSATERRRNCRYCNDADELVISLREEKGVL